MTHNLSRTSPHWGEGAGLKIIGQREVDTVYFDLASHFYGQIRKMKMVFFFSQQYPRGGLREEGPNLICVSRSQTGTNGWKLWERRF